MQQHHKAWLENNGLKSQRFKSDLLPNQQKCIKMPPSFDLNWKRRSRTKFFSSSFFPSVPMAASILPRNGEVGIPSYTQSDHSGMKKGMLLTGSCCCCKAKSLPSCSSSDNSPRLSGHFRKKREKERGDKWRERDFRFRNGRMSPGGALAVQQKMVKIERGGGKELASFVMHSSRDFCHAFLCRLPYNDSAKRFSYRVVEVVSAVVEYLD